jgi:polysaccharide export outer membrane protein
MKTLLTLLAALGFGLLSLLSPAMAEGYAVRAGDVLKIEVVEDPSLNRSVLVAPDGRISVPQAGTIKVAGQSVDVIGAAIAAMMAKDFAATPNVFVSLDRLAERAPGAAAKPATVSVYVMGEATKAGKLDVAPGTTVLQAFAEMGGFTKFAATKRIVLRRTDAKTGTVTNFALNYQAIEAGTTPDGNIALQPGDVILVPQRRLFE